MQVIVNKSTRTIKINAGKKLRYYKNWPIIRKNLAIGKIIKRVRIIN